ncbi:MAG: SAM-dependent methyltransferase [Candidatus Odinarchaeota archaeon]
MTKERDHHKNEKFYRKAKKEGYRARSAYKLFDIQKMYNIFKRAFYILDIGCAPGSWLQVIKKFAEKNLGKYNDQYYYRDHFKIMGIDIVNTTPIENIHIIKADVTKPEIQAELDNFFYSKLDLVVSDASIKKIGNKFTDHIRQLTLCYKIMDIVKRNLKFNGNLVIKVFQGSDFNKFYQDIKPLFRILKAYKPQSSKKKSNEIYLIGLQKKN